MRYINSHYITYALHTPHAVSDLVLNLTSYWFSGFLLALYCIPQLRTIISTLVAAILTSV